MLLGHRLKSGNITESFIQSKKKVWGAIQQFISGLSESISVPTNVLSLGTVLVHAAISKILHGLNDAHLFLTVSEAGNSKTKVRQT